MTKHFRKFILQNFIALIFLGLAEFALFTYSPINKFFHLIYPLVLILSFIVNVIVYHIFTRKSVPANRSMVLLGQSFAIKFFYYLTLAIIFIYMFSEKEQRICFVVSLFIIYFAFTFIEVKAITAFIKSDSNNS